MKVEGVRPSAAWYFVAAGIAVASWVSVVLLFVWTAHDDTHELGPLAFASPARFEKEVARAGNYAVYAQVAGDTETCVSGFTIELTDERGGTIPVRCPTGTLENPVYWRAHSVAQFTREQPGRVRAAATWERTSPPAEVYFGIEDAPPPQDAIRATAFLVGCYALLAGGPTIAAGMGYAVLVLRAESKRQRHVEAVQQAAAARRAATRASP